MYACACAIDIYIPMCAVRVPVELRSMCVCMCMPVVLRSMSVWCDARDVWSARVCGMCVAWSACVCIM